MSFSVLLSHFSVVFFSSVVTTGKAAVIHRQLHNCVYARISVVTQKGRQEEHKEDGVKKDGNKGCAFPDKLWTAFIHLTSFIVSAGVFFLSHLLLRSSYHCTTIHPHPPIPSIPTCRVTGLWNVKNCSMHGNSLSCQTSLGQPQATGRQWERERDRKRYTEKKKNSPFSGSCSRLTG